MSLKNKMSMKNKAAFTIVIPFAVCAFVAPLFFSRADGSQELTALTSIKEQAVKKQAASKKAWPNQQKQFVDKHCKSCHNAKKHEGDLNFDELPYDLADNKARDFWNKIVEQLTDGAMPPEEAKVHPNAADKKAFLAMLKVSMKKADKTAAPGGTLLRRLSQVEYFNSVQAIIPFRAFKKPVAFPPETNEAEFDTNPEGVFLSGPLLKAYMDFATIIADEAVFLSTNVEVDKVSATRENVQRYGKNANRGNMNMKDFRFSGVNIASDTGAMSIPAYIAPYKGRYRLKLKVNAESDKGADGKPLRLVICTSGFIGGEKKINPNGIRYSISKELARVNVTNQAVHEIELDLSLNKWEQVYVYCDNRLSEGDYAIADNSRVQQKILIKAMKNRAPSVIFHGMTLHGPLGETDDQKAFLQNQEPKATPQYVESVLLPIAEKAYRRPLLKKEKQELVKAVLTHAKTRTIRHGLHYGVRWIFTSPFFLYHNVDLDGQMSDYALASRLSYFLWSTIPDQKLLDLAKTKKLSDKAVLKQQVIRMLKSPKAYQFTKNFTGQWLQNRMVAGIMADPKHGLGEGEQKGTYTTITELFFQEILEKNLSIRNFIESDFTYMTDVLAEKLRFKIKGKLTGTPDKILRRPHSVTRGNGLGKYDPKMMRIDLTQYQNDDAIKHRGGLLGLPGIHLTTADGIESNPIMRGVWVLENFFGLSVGEPPANVPTLEADTSEARTIAEKVLHHTKNPKCAMCHVKIDPIGLALENFNAVGKWRTQYDVVQTKEDKKKKKPTKAEKIKAKEEKNKAKAEKKKEEAARELANKNKTEKQIKKEDKKRAQERKKANDKKKKKGRGKSKESGKPIESTQKYLSGDVMKTPADIKKYLMKNSHMFTHCLLEKLLGYGAGRRVSVGDKRIIKELIKQEPADGYKFRDLIIKLVQSKAFLSQ